MTTKEQEVAAAVRQMIEPMRAMANIIPYEARRQYVKALAQADTNADGVVSSKELAEAMFKQDGLLWAGAADRLRKFECVPTNEPVVQSILFVNQITAIRTLEVIHGSKESIPARAKKDAPLILKGALEKVMDRASGVNMNSPEIQKAFVDLGKAAEQAMVEMDTQMKRAHSELVNRKEIGVLPKQILPFKKEDLCKHLGRKTS